MIIYGLDTESDTSRSEFIVLLENTRMELDQAEYTGKPTEALKRKIERLEHVLLDEFATDPKTFEIIMEDRE